MSGGTGVRSLHDLSVVVLSYNRREEIERGVAALCELSVEHGFELIVVDNASTDGSGEVLRALSARYPLLRALHNTSNLGGAGGRNTGWRAATRRYILSIDEDIVITAEQMRALCAAMDEDPRIGVLASRISDAATGRVLNDFGPERIQVPTFYEACHLVRREAMEVVGVGDPECFAAGEGFDYSLRMHAAGYMVCYTPEVTVVHRDRVREPGESAERRQQWVETFTRIYFKHFPLRTAVLFSVRYLLTHVVSGARSFGIRYAATLPGPLLSGARRGLQRRRVVPPETMRYYTRASYPRDFGQKPILAKAIRSLRSGGRA